MSGLAMAATALGSVLAAPRVGRLADRIGHAKVVVTCLVGAGLLLVPQALFTSGWQLVALRFLMGVALGGLLPTVTALIRLSVPDRVSGSVLGYSQSAQYLEHIVGPLVGGIVGSHLGMSAVFLATSVLLLAGAGLNLYVFRTPFGCRA